MDVRVWVARDVVVDDYPDFRDIKTPRRDVGSDQDAGGGGAEAAEIVCSLALGEFGVQGCDAVLEQAQQVR